MVGGAVGFADFFTPLVRTWSGAWHRDSRMMAKMDMGITVGVLGPGAVGGTLAVSLARAGARVVCIARSETAEEIAREGLTLERLGEVMHARPEVTETLREPVDVLLVTVKAPALEEALDRIDEAPATIVSLLNGLEHVDVVRGRLGGRVLAGSIGRLEAYRTSPTRIVQTTPAPLITVTAPLEPLSRAGFDIHVEPNERAVLWEKVVRLAPLAAATAITQRTLGELRDDPDWRATLEAAVAEACAVAAADGVSLNPEAQWEILDTMPASVTTSAARDAAAGRPTELDAILGGVVRAADRLGVETPTLERLLDEAGERCRPRLR
jgi:2-dehydropantoate 2-reductase